MTKKIKMTRTIFGLPPNQKERLAALAQHIGLSEAEILRRALREFFERQEVDAHYASMNQGENKEKS